MKHLTVPHTKQKKNTKEKKQNITQLHNYHF